MSTHVVNLPAISGQDKPTCGLCTVSTYWAASFRGEIVRRPLLSVQSFSSISAVGSDNNACPLGCLMEHRVA
jgi:hypothetical protein